MAIHSGSFTSDIGTRSRRLEHGGQETDIRIHIRRMDVEMPVGSWMVGLTSLCALALYAPTMLSERSIPTHWLA